MEELKKLHEFIRLKKEKEFEMKEKYLLSWTIGDYSFHAGRESAFMDILSEIDDMLGIL